MDATFQFMNVSEAADELGMTGGGVRQLLIDGKLQAIKANGRAWLIPYVEVQRYKEKPYTVGRRRKCDDRP